MILEKYKYEVEYCIESKNYKLVPLGNDFYAMENNKGNFIWIGELDQYIEMKKNMELKKNV